MDYRSAEHNKQVDDEEGQAKATLENRKPEDVGAAGSTRDSEIATSKLTTDYQDVIHDRFQKARRNKSSFFKTRVEDSISGAASMLQSMFLGRMKLPVEESDDERANRIMDELDASFKPTLKSRLAAVDDQGQRQIGQRGWRWLKPW